MPCYYCDRWISPGFTHWLLMYDSISDDDVWVPFHLVCKRKWLVILGGG